MSFVAVGAAIAGSVVSVGLSYALAPDAPDAPDMGAASRAGVEAEAETLADRRRLEAAAQQGGQVTWTDRGTKQEQRQFALVPGPDGRQGLFGLGGELVPYVAEEWAEGGKYYDPKKPNYQPSIQTQTVTVPGGQKTADFTGYGEADVQGKIARQMAEIELELSRKYGTQFVEEAKKQLELADPQGTAARGRLYELIQQQIENDPERPVADLLDSQVSEQLAAGSGLDRVSQEMLDQAIAEAQGSRGEKGQGGTDFAEPMTTGFEGQQRLDAAQQKALGWLASGATPEDVAFRREQQNLGNLSAFMAGRTPESQFETLSGAQQGAAPFYQGNKLPGQNPNAGPAMQGAQLQGWNTQMGAAANQADPWLGGLSALLSGASAAGNAGWKPLAQGV
jgi:hypothetical protein